MEPHGARAPRDEVNAGPIDVGGGLIRNVGYEVMPFKDTEAAVKRHVRLVVDKIVDKLWTIWVAPSRVWISGGACCRGVSRVDHESSRVGANPT